MKKHIFPVAALLMSVVSFVSCDDDLVKDDIDAKYLSKAEISAPVYSDLTYNSVTMSYEISNAEDMTLAYCGILISEDESFVDVISCSAAPGEQTTMNVLGETNYFAKAYVVVGTETRYSEVVKFTTPKAPEFVDKYLFGHYLAYDDGDDSYVYEMEISHVEGSYNRIYITNWWDGGETITASVDFETKSIIVDDEPHIYKYPDYGWVIFYGVTDDQTALTPNPIGYYDENGHISFPLYDIYIGSAGDQGFGCTDMDKTE